VTVELSPSVAAAATCRLWQERQRVVELPGGGVHLTFSVRDQAEVVRWAFGFGAEARVIAPASAVALARTMLTDLQAVHATDAGPRRATRSA
jgi:predicted DNA-binding transcriptional regulator YafY